MRTLILVLMVVAISMGPMLAEEPKLTPEQKEKVAQGSSLAQQAFTLRQEGKINEAIVRIEESQKIVREILGETNEKVLGGIKLMAELQGEAEDFTASQKTWAELVSLCSKVYGTDYWQTVDAKWGLRDSKQIATMNAEQRSQLAKAGKLHTVTFALHEQGKYTEAIAIAETVVRIRIEILGQKHPDYALSLNSLAILYDTMGTYAKAEPLFIEGLKIRKEALGEKHPDYATSLNNLAGLYCSQGLYAKAEPLFIEGLKICKEALGEKHPDYATSLNNLAHLYVSQVSYAKAEPLFLEALKIRREVLGEKHPSYATSLNSLATLYDSLGLYPKAEPLYVEALKITKESLGEKHSSYAACLNNLALSYISQRLYDKAEPLFLEALKIRKDALGEKHPDYAASLNHLAHLYESKGQYAKAESLYLSVVTIQQDNLQESAAIQSEADQIQHLAKVRIYLDNLLSLPEAEARALYASVFRWHGAVTARQMFHRAANHTSREIGNLSEELRDVTRQLNRLSQNPPEAMSKTELAKQIKELDDQRELLQKKTAGLMKDIAMYLSPLNQTPADLQRSLPDDTALIDFLVHKDSISAFIISKTAIHRVVLKAGKDLDEDLAAFLGDLSLSRIRPVNSEFDVSAKLRRRIWEPLEEHLKGITRVLICPDGALCRLPFAALPGADPKRYLLEELSIVIVPVPQLLPGLLNVKANKTLAAPSLLAVGDVDFDGDPAPLLNAKAMFALSPTRAGKGLNWMRLPNTKDEVEVVEALFGNRPDAKVKRLSGNKATEAALEGEMPKHRFLHLATHGFFAPPKFVRQIKEGQAVGDENVLVPVVPPGLSSGLVCAGANNPTFQSSGILTASQIVELDLRLVELVVLSACETGLGELAGGEGVMGLQRAFQIAGARSTITTLWSIPDKATAELMKRMYANRLEKSLAAAEALREAQLWALNNGEKVGAFDAPPRPGKRTPPKYWAAFTFAGDWR